MQAPDFMLLQQAPFPARVVERLWNLVMFNEPAAGMMRWLLGTNLMRRKESKNPARLYFAGR
jgi:hypothetical protein